MEVHSGTGRISPSSQRKIIPELFYSDNGPQFTSQKFVDFAGAYRLNTETHTSRPRFVRSNEEADVQTVKQLLNKAQDPNLALLAYRDTPLTCSYSSAQLLMREKYFKKLFTCPEQDRVVCKHKRLKL